MLDIHKVTLSMCYALETSSHLECGGTSGLMLPIKYSKDGDMVTPMTLLLCKTPSQQSRARQFATLEEVNCHDVKGVGEGLKP